MLELDVMVGHDRTNIIAMARTRPLQWPAEPNDVRGEAKTAAMAESGNCYTAGELTLAI